MTPKICVILATDEDGNQKYVELTQQQALAYNAGALPIIQVRGCSKAYFMAKYCTQSCPNFFWQK